MCAVPNPHCCFRWLAKPPEKRKAAASQQQQLQVSGAASPPTAPEAAQAVAAAAAVATGSAAAAAAEVAAPPEEQLQALTLAGCPSMRPAGAPVALVATALQQQQQQGTAVAPELSSSNGPGPGADVSAALQPAAVGSKGLAGAAAGTLKADEQGERGREETRTAAAAAAASPEDVEELRGAQRRRTGLADGGDPASDGNRGQGLGGPKLPHDLARRVASAEESVRTFLNKDADLGRDYMELFLKKVGVAV